MPGDPLPGGRDVYAMHAYQDPARRQLSPRREAFFNSAVIVPDRTFYDFSDYRPIPGLHL